MAWDVLYYRTSSGNVAGLNFLMGVGRPTNVRATTFAVLDAVADASPPRFSGGGMWEAMHRDMAASMRSGSRAPRTAPSTGKISQEFTCCVRACQDARLPKIRTNKGRSTYKLRS